MGAAVTARVLHAALGPYWEQPQQVSVDGRASKFTLMVMSYDKRAESLKTYIRHYGQCPSVGEAEGVVRACWRPHSFTTPGAIALQLAYHSLALAAALSTCTNA